MSQLYAILYDKIAKLKVSQAEYPILSADYLIPFHNWGYFQFLSGVIPYFDPESLDQCKSMLVELCPARPNSLCVTSFLKLAYEFMMLADKYSIGCIEVIDRLLEKLEPLTKAGMYIILKSAAPFAFQVMIQYIDQEQLFRRHSIFFRNVYLAMKKYTSDIDFDFFYIYLVFSQDLDEIYQFIKLYQPEKLVKTTEIKHWWRLMRMLEWKEDDKDMLLDKANRVSGYVDEEFLSKYAIVRE